MGDIRTIVHRKIVEALVGRCLGICTRTGDSFDVRTAVVLLDRDGDPAAVLSQRGWADIVRACEVERLQRAGLTADPATVGRTVNRHLPADTPRTAAPTIVEQPLFDVVGETVVEIPEN